MSLVMLLANQMVESAFVSIPVVVPGLLVAAMPRVEAVDYALVLLSAVAQIQITFLWEQHTNRSVRPVRRLKSSPPMINALHF